MPRDVARAALYRGAINLWVEDELSREYLSALWNDPAVAFFIAGGNDGVYAVTRDAEKAGFPNVFGLVDRDFRPTNRNGWTDPGKTFRTFVLPVHEIENYLLDSAALAASRFNTLRQNGDEIEDHLFRAAKRLTWWFACREVVAELKRRFRDEFVADPPATITDETTAIDHIRVSSWYCKLADEAVRSTETDVRRLLAEAHIKSCGMLDDGRWRVEFAGKEVYHDLGSRICDRVQMPGYRPSKAEFDTDLAKDVAAWQRETGRVPPDLVAVLAALHARIRRSVEPTPGA